MNIRMGQIDGFGSGDAFRTNRLPDGRWLSLTGDSTRPGETLPAYDNSAIIWDNQGQRRIGVGNFFPRWDDGSEFWPAGFIVNGQTASVIGSRQLVAGEFNWTAMGAYGAVVNIPACGQPTFVRYFSTPSSGQDDTAVQWSAAIAQTGTWAYIHGVLDRPDAFHARDGGYVARVPAGQIENLSRWEYWAGSTWSTSPAAAVPTIPVGGSGTNGTEAGYTVHKRDGWWQVTTKSAGTLADTVGRYRSANPTGPWTWTPLVTACGLECYLAGAADTIPTLSGQQLVYWSRSGANPYWVEVAR